MKLILKNILRSKFLIDFAQLSTSGALGKLLFILFTPLITRIYSPEQFAQFAVFTSLLVVFYPLFSGRYEYAIITAKNESQAKQIFTLTIFIIIFSIMVSSISLFIGSNFNFKLIDLKSLNYIIYLVPFGIAVQAFLNTLKVFASRYRKFSIISQSIFVNSFFNYNTFTKTCIFFSIRKRLRH